MDEDAWLDHPRNGSLLEKDAKKFIENAGSKRHRVSTHPDFVACDRDNLLRHTDAEARAVAKNGEGW